MTFLVSCFFGLLRAAGLPETLPLWAALAGFALALVLARLAL
jgi:hypothetical protein